MIKQFLMKQALKVGMKGASDEEKEIMMALINSNPELFEKIAKEIKELTDSGKPQMYAAMDIMKKYQKEMMDAIIKSGVDPSKLQQVAGKMGALMN